MASSLIKERNRALPSFAMPLNAPDVEAAWDFLSAIIPSTVFSSGSGRRRRRGEQPRPDGQRSDQGYLVLYRRQDLDAQPQLTPLKSPASLLRYLQGQLTAPLADHWVATQITQYRARKDGSQLAAGFTAETARHIMSIVVDLDGTRMAARYRDMLQNDWWAFKEAVEERLDALGIGMYLVVRSGPDGAHVHIPLIRPDGRPLRATEDNLACWERAARGVCRQFKDLGADANAVRPTQPFALPGLPRLKHDGFVPYIAAQRLGARANLFALIRRLSELKLMTATRPRLQLVDRPGAPKDVASLLEEIRERAAGVQSGSRNDAGGRLAAYLLAKGATPDEAWDAMKVWNRRNAPSLSERELRACLRSAERCRARSPQKWAEMVAAPWHGLRGLLGLPSNGSTGYLAGGRWRPITAPKSWEDRKFGGGREHYHEVEERLMAQLTLEGGQWETTRKELAELLGTAKSTLNEVLKRLEASGHLQVNAKRGRGGKTTLVAAETVRVDNVQSGITSEAAKQGAWVGLASAGAVDLVESPVQVAAGDLEGGASGGPLGVLASILWKRLGLELGEYQPVPVMAVVDREGLCRLVARSWQGRDILRVLEALGGVEEIAGWLGCRVVVEIAAGREGDDDEGLPGGD